MLLLSCVLVSLHVLSVEAAAAASPHATTRRPVFLKFYKVGSESVVDFFLRMSVDPRSYKSWVLKTPACEGLPMDHKSLSLFIEHGPGLAAACTRLRPANLSTAPSQSTPSSSSVDLVTVLRDPVQRLISQLFFFSGPITEYHLFSTGQLSVADSKRSADMKALWQRLLHRPRSVTASDMRRFLLFLQHREVRGPFFPRLSLQSYEVVLSRLAARPLHSDEQSLLAARTALDGFAAVGTMEHMPSLFVLLSLEFGHPLTDSCFLNNRHSNKRQRYPKPQARDWQAGVLAAMQEFVVHDSLIWQHAQQVHERQLLRHNLTVQSATARWKQACRGVQRTEALTPQMWLDGARQAPVRPQASSSVDSSVDSRGNAQLHPSGPGERRGHSGGDAERGSGNNDFRAVVPDADSAALASHHRTVKYVGMCALFTLLFFYGLSRI